MKRFLPLLSLLIAMNILSAAKEPSLPSLDSSWIRKQLSDDGPRLIWRQGDEALIKERIKSDEMAARYYGLLIEQADALLDIPTLERIQIGRRLLDVSRQALQRTTMLAFAWRMTQEPKYAKRLEDEIRALCAFSDWNPSHFLDVAEMSMGIALAIDWAQPGLSPEVVALGKTALLEKGLQPSLKEEFNYWKHAPMNWNQVCHAGMAAAALLCFEEDPTMCTQVINLMLEGLPYVLRTYAPDGVYVEGGTYWSYGTGFNVLLFSLLETALGTSFDLERYPGFMESADFVHYVKAPSGLLFNFFDCSDSMGFSPPLLWFAMKTGNERHLQRTEFNHFIESGVNPAGRSFRLGPAGFLWFIHTDPSRPKDDTLALSWYGRSKNPIVVFRSSFDHPDALYLAAKGGKATLNHGNMDAGSFIFELNGIRWAIDPGNQSYHELEETFKAIGGSLWNSDQDSKRWTLLTKNNFGHNTLRVDDDLHFNEGAAVVTGFDAEKKIAAIDLTEPLKGKVQKALRTFQVIDDQRIEIRDEVILSPDSSKLVWQMLTQADVTVAGKTAILRQKGKELKLTVQANAAVNLSIISLDPPPLFYDKVIPGLKRIEVSVPAYEVENHEVDLKVILDGNVQR